ncbi:diguanylate cyclase domain-containing protein [Alteromonas sp. CYL-A6]|uniref:diguanylate cyclase domain-containing protein n=1 Tax=Alteromonas nitratireducens TaxID=3390813 RepID=UPI003983B942
MRETYNVFVTAIFNNRDRITGAILVIIDNSELVLAHERIEKSQEQLLSIMNNSLAIIALKDNAGRYEFVNARFEERFGVTARDIIGRTDLQVFSRDIATLFRERDLDTMRSLAPMKSTDELDIDGNPVTLESVRFPIFDAEGTIKSVCTQATDITRPRHENEQLRLAGKIVEQASEGLIITDSDFMIRRVNGRVHDMLQLPADTLTGQPISELGLHPATTDTLDSLRDLLKRDGAWQGEMIVNVGQNASSLRLWATIDSVHSDQQSGQEFVFALNDVTDIEHVQQRIAFLASHDGLTRLPNRTELLNRLALMTGYARHAGSVCAVLHLDIDQFKTLNDAYGTTVGDVLLKQFAVRLEGALHETELLARVDDDAFVALLAVPELSALDNRIRAVLETLHAPFSVSGQNLTLSVSGGVSVYPFDGDTSSELLKHAEAALLMGKEHAPGQIQYYTEDMRKDNASKQQAADTLSRALSDEAFDIRFLPVMDLASGGIISASASLSYHDKAIETELVRQLADAAENSTLIASLDLLKLELVLNALRGWQQQGLSVPRIMLTMSDRQWRKVDFVHKVSELLKQYGIRGEKLMFGISDTCLGELDVATSEVMSSIHKLGIRLSVSEFGKTALALPGLLNPAIGELRLSADMATSSDHKDAASVRYITALLSFGRAMGLPVVIQQVDTAAQLDMVKQCGGELVQGEQITVLLDTAEFAAAMKQQA